MFRIDFQGDLVLTGGVDKTAVLFNTTKEQVVNTFKGHQVLLIRRKRVDIKNYSIRLVSLLRDSLYFTPPNSISNCRCMNIDFISRTRTKYHHCIMLKTLSFE